jgi:hypothetical protein|tara:strand:+ start:38482 stop:39864 length:1383 start_codon:yes stop_codon:yes gene_type:complete
MSKRYLFFLATLTGLNLTGQVADPDPVFIQNVYQRALGDQQGYFWLSDLCKDVGPRLAGSAGDAKAVKWAFETLDTLGYDKVLKQEVDVRHWVRGVETAEHLFKGKRTELNITALGGSISTPGGDSGNGLTAQVVEVKNRKDLYAKASDLKGKVVFFNEPMDPWLINTGSAYGKAGWQRWGGASEAAKYGAVAVLVRSLTHRLDDFPHTGAMTYEQGVKKIPAAAISTNGAEWLSKELVKNPESKVKLILGSRDVGRKSSANIIAEWKGSEKPDEVILVGGHLDSWDLGTGAQDDGAGVAHAMHAVWLLKSLGYRPRHTIRIVLFANEEFGLDGAKKYAKEGLEEGRKHILCIESDGGSGAPRGFSLPPRIHDLRPELIDELDNLLARYGCKEWTQGGSGADVSQITDKDVVLCGYRADSQRYFDYHHTSQDDIKSVHPRELELGSASIASFLYFFDKKL